VDKSKVKKDNYSAIMYPGIGFFDVNGYRTFCILCLNSARMTLRRWIRSFFGFSRAQTNGFILLLPLVGMAVFSEPVFRWWQSRNPRNFSEERAKLDSLSQWWRQDEANSVPEENERAVKLFAFDPNVVSQDELLALGFSVGLSKRLINYRSKGGNFKVKTDLLRLYGMDSAFYNVLEPYIGVPEKEIIQTETLPPPRREYKKRELVRFDLNVADTMLLKSVYGIGSRLSSRIVTLRESLGGFVSADQLYEVYALDSTVIARLLEVSFIHDDFQPRTLNLNTATESELGAHPYISKRMAVAIVTYRFQHGKYTSVDDLRNILRLDDNQLLKIRPYLSVD
jgi:competence protein ComEA